MTRYLELADYLLIAEAVIGVPAELIADFNRIGLADSALAAPQAAFGGVEAYPDFATKAAVRSACCHRAADGHGLGFRIGDATFMGALAASEAVGHTGFTGTSLVIEATRRLVVVLLTNRVHPSRDWSDIARVRRRVAEVAVAAAAADAAGKGRPA